MEARSFYQEGDRIVKVLLIDDDPTVRDDLRLFLPPEVVVVWVAGGEEAIERIRAESNLKAIILDLCLPPFLGDREQSEGLELLSVIRTRLPPAIPVIVLSSLPKGYAESECLKRGALAYLEKSGRPDDLVRLLLSLPEHPSG